MGDATGVGPEIIVKSLAERENYEICRPVVIGDKGIMERAVKIVGADLKCHSIQHPSDGGNEFGVIDIIDLQNLPADLPFATVDGRAGKAAYEYVERAVQYALKHEIHAVVTAPLNKEALNLGGYHYPGHTEILAQLAGTKDYAMMLVGGPLRVIHVTTHVALRQACDLVKKERVLKVIELANEAVKLLGIKEPRIAVAGLNCHSGEGGLFGTEDQEEIAPAVEEAKKKGLNVSGPIPPDTVFYRAAIKNHFDIVVVMYHDQGHIPLKIIGFETGVNITVGLPYIRTSVDHGTAFGKAGKGTADHQSMTESIKLGTLMAKTKYKL
jgi:4-hydroxythreonine-4-phosphate dehydrogenase